MWQIVTLRCLFTLRKVIFNDSLYHAPAGEDDDDEECGEEKLPSCFDYVMHFLTVFWKVLFAFVPPTDYWNGWACFVVSIIMIGVLTAFIGDLASHFGCTIGLKDSVTAVVFVALGTSVPGEKQVHLPVIFAFQPPIFIFTYSHSSQKEDVQELVHACV